MEIAVSGEGRDGTGWSSQIDPIAVGHMQQAQIPGEASATGVREFSWNGRLSRPGGERGGGSEGEPANDKRRAESGYFQLTGAFDFGLLRLCGVEPA